MVGNVNKIFMHVPLHFKQIDRKTETNYYLYNGLLFGVEWILIFCISCLFLTSYALVLNARRVLEGVSQLEKVQPA